MRRKQRKIFAFLVYFVIFVFVASIWISFVAYFFPATPNYNENNNLIDSGGINSNNIENMNLDYLSWLNKLKIDSNEQQLNTWVYLTGK